MIPSGRLIVLVLAGTVPVLAGGPGSSAAILIAIIYNGILAAALLFDFFITARPAGFSLDREFESKMSIGEENPVRVNAKNHTSHPIKMIIKDEPPAVNFTVIDRVRELRLPAGEEASVVYRLIPAKRGDYSFGSLNYRYFSRLGLFIRQAECRCENCDIKVYPNIIDIRRHALKAQKGFLREAGLRPAVIRGLGTDFEGLREYVPDDEYRRVNWTASARRGKLVSNEFQDEKSQNGSWFWTADG